MTCTQREGCVPVITCHGVPMICGLELAVSIWLCNLCSDHLYVPYLLLASGLILLG